jgi:hypothetical protein
VRRETGRRQRVQVLYGEGVAIHTGPESCAGRREATREALTGERIGQPLSGEIPIIRSADALVPAEGQHGRARDRECPIGSAPSETLACAHVFCAGTGRSPHCPGLPRLGPHGEGRRPKSVMHDAEKSDPSRVPRKSANNAAFAAAEPMPTSGRSWTCLHNTPWFMRFGQKGRIAGLRP